jgi:hypothetical protein
MLNFDVLFVTAEIDISKTSYSRCEMERKLRVSYERVDRQKEFL